MNQPIILTRLDVLKHRIALHRSQFRDAKEKGDAWAMRCAERAFEGAKEALEKAGVTVSATIHK